MTKPAKDQPATPSPSPLEVALEALTQAREAREMAEHAEALAVDAARQAGASWTKIGQVYGLTKQGAQQRFKKPATPDEVA